MSASQIDPQLKDLADAGKLGQVVYTWGGEAQTSADEFPYLIQAILLGIILSYMLMAALFNNMLYPLSVMLTLPQALVGALAALLITGTPFSLITAIGVIMLNGIATKNAILMVDYTNTLRARGYKRMDAILEAAPTRLRPVLMTSFRDHLRDSADRRRPGTRRRLPAAAGRHGRRRRHRLHVPDAAGHSQRLPAV